MAALPPVSRSSSSSTPMDFVSFMKSQGVGGIGDLPGGGTAYGAHEATNLRRMIDELERTRGRYESEKSSALQFGKQMDMLAKQIGSLGEQQQSLLGFHIVRIKSMIEDLRKSADNIDRDAQREKQREETGRLHQELARRERADREHRERQLLQQQREKEKEKEQKDERERAAAAAAERERQQERLRQQFLQSPASTKAAAASSALSSPSALPPTAASTSSSASASASGSVAAALPPPEDIDVANLPGMDWAGDMKSFPEFMEFMKRQQQQTKESDGTDSSKRHSIGPTSASVLDASIPAPSRTVSPTSQKRRRSVPAPGPGLGQGPVPAPGSGGRGAGGGGGPSSSSSSASSPSPSPANKRAKLSRGDSDGGDGDGDAVSTAPPLNRKRVNAEPPTTADNDAMSDVEATSTDDPADVVDGAGAAGAPLEDALPPELQAQLQAQALAMLQAQMEQQEVEKNSSDAMMDTDTSAGGGDNPIAPPKELTPPRGGQGDRGRGHSHSSPQPRRSAEAPKPKAEAVAAIKAAAGVEAEAGQPPAAFSAPAAVKAEKAEAAVAASKPASKPKKKSKAAKAEPVQAVEDTTIANPESVPLKNKAIYQWMAKDPERLYTADDIVAAGIRYRVFRKSRTEEPNRVYILQSKKQTQDVLRKKTNSHLFRRDSGDPNSWRVVT